MLMKLNAVPRHSQVVQNLFWDAAFPGKKYFLTLIFGEQICLIFYEF